MKEGDIVFTDEERFRNEWWFKWPAVVRDAPEGEDDATVEFMGFAQMVTRRRKFARHHLKQMDDDEIRARLDRVLRYIRLPSGNQRAETPFTEKKPQSKVTAKKEAQAELPEE